MKSPNWPYDEPKRREKMTSVKLLKMYLRNVIGIMIITMVFVVIPCLLTLLTKVLYPVGIIGWLLYFPAFITYRDWKEGEIDE